MILAPHIIVGAVIGSKIHNFWLVAILGLVSYFVLDQIPHWDYLTHQEIVDFRKGKKIRTILKTSIDVIIGLIFLFIFICNHQFNSDQLVLIIVGVFFSILPDLVWGLSMISNNKILLKYRDFNDKIGYKSKKEGKITFLGLFTQILVIIVALFAFFF